MCAVDHTAWHREIERATTPSKSDVHLRRASALSRDFRGRIGPNAEGSRLYSYGCLREGGGFSRATWWSGRVAAFSTCELPTNAISLSMRSLLLPPAASKAVMASSSARNHERRRPRDNGIRAKNVARSRSSQRRRVR